jgi:hypothetical protein
MRPQSPRALPVHDRRGAGAAHDPRPLGRAASEAFGTLVSCVAALGVREPGPVAHIIFFCAMHGLIDLTVKKRTIPGRAEPLDVQIDRMLNAMLAYAQAQIPLERLEIERNA